MAAVADAPLNRLLQNYYYCCCCYSTITTTTSCTATTTTITTTITSTTIAITSSFTTIAFPLFRIILHGLVKNTSSYEFTVCVCCLLSSASDVLLEVRTRSRKAHIGRSFRYGKIHLMFVCCMSVVVLRFYWGPRHIMQLVIFVVFISYLM
jgi:hypothetical protein